MDWVLSVISVCKQNLATIIIIILGLSLILYRRILRSSGNLPPGPKPWPVIGNLTELRGDPVQATVRLREKYGDVYRLYLGNFLAVFVNGHSAINDVLVTKGEDFLDRPKVFLMEEISDCKGLSSVSGQMWKEQRRFALHSLRNFGFGKSTLEGNVHQEAELLRKEFEETRGADFSPVQLISNSVANVICELAFGRHFPAQDEKFQNFLRQLNNILQTAGTSPMSFMPWLKYIPGDPFGYGVLVKGVEDLLDFVRGEIAEHKETFNPLNPRDFIDAYLMEINRLKEEGIESTFDEATLAAVVGEIFGGGTDTISTTLRWALVYLANNPDVQVKLQDEIRSVIPPSRLPSLSDKPKMPYTQAVIMEIQRCGDIGPLGVPHAASVDTTLKGYHIPRGTFIMPMLNSLHKDPLIWPEPEVFDPTRFLELDGTVKPSKNLLPFSTGKRVCPGESMAKIEIFLFLTSLFQRFTIKPPDGVKRLSEEGVTGMSRSPKSFRIRAIPLST